MPPSIEELAGELEELRARVRRHDDIEAIKALHRRYIRALADRDWHGLPDFFTEDAVTDIRWHGRTESRQELHDKVINELADLVTSPDGYILSSPVIELEPGADIATGEWTWHRHICQGTVGFASGVTRVWGPWMEGRYRCVYERVGDDWKFKDVWFRVVLPEADPE